MNTREVGVLKVLPKRLQKVTRKKIRAADPSEYIKVQQKSEQTRKQ